MPSCPRPPLYLTPRIPSSLTWVPQNRLAFGHTCIFTIYKVFYEYFLQKIMHLIYLYFMHSFVNLNSCIFKEQEQATLQLSPQMCWAPKLWWHFYIIQHFEPVVWNMTNKHILNLTNIHIILKKNIYVKSQFWWNIIFKFEKILHPPKRSHE